MAIDRYSISAAEESRIIIGLIVSTEFYERIKPILKIEYFTNSYIKIIAGWCDAFFEQYGKAPFLHIRDIFQSESAFLKPAESELIEILLGKLDSSYVEGEINVDYWSESAKDYFRQRELEITLNNIQVLKDKGDLEEAEKEIERFHKVTLDLDVRYIINPSDLETQEEIYRQRDEEEKEFFVLPGDLGKYLRNQKRGDVVAYYGPPKRGKSFVLIDQFKHGINNRKRTLFFSIEMTRTEIIPRINKAFFPSLDLDEEEGMHSFPVFDCFHNQNGSCKDRISEVVVRESENELVYDPGHRICTKCRNSYEKEERKRYKMAFYQNRTKRVHDDIFNFRKNYKLVKNDYRKYARVSVHPKYSLTYDNMMRDIEVIWKKEQWSPDILIIDYVDILFLDSKFNDYKLEDERWKMLAKIAGELNVLVITATQGNKAAHSADVLDATHQGGFYGKARHVNLMIGLNQKPDEKAMGVMNYGITEGRSVKYVQGQMCTVLQDFKTGQACLDSYYPYK